MQRRQENINQDYGRTFADLEAVCWLPRLGDGNALMVFENGRARHTPLFDQLLSLAKEHGAQFIVTDTLADVFAGNENDRGQARMFAQAALGYLSREINGAVLALAHPSLAGIASGEAAAGQPAGAAFSVANLSHNTKTLRRRPPDPHIRSLIKVKANFAPRCARAGRRSPARSADAADCGFRLKSPGIPG
jgi:RecA-family ATPase